MGLNPRYIVDFSEIYKVDGELVGKKVHELGILWKLGVPLPDGFVITTEFFREFLNLVGLDKEIEKVQAISHPPIKDSMPKLFELIKKQLMHSYIPEHLVLDLHKFYRKLSGTFKNKSLNIFSSTFNNKSHAFNNVKGDANLIMKIKTIWSMSLDSPVAIAVQENIKSKIKGQVFTDNPIVDKKLTEKQVSTLIDYCNVIQRYFYFPKEIEYVVKKNKIFLTKINPFTGIADSSVKVVNRVKKTLIKGMPINPGIVTGPVKILHNKYSDIIVKKGDIIVLPNLDSRIFKKLKNAKAVVVDSIMLNPQNKTLYRKDFQIPTIEGAKDATKIFKDGSIVTVNGANGEIYSGGLVY